MKTYLIKQSDIMHKGKIFPEGSTIDLDDKDALQLSNYLEESIVNVTLSGVEGSSLLNNKEQNTKNKKRSK
jgi:hypothetical protein